MKETCKKNANKSRICSVCSCSYITVKIVIAMSRHYRSTVDKDCTTTVTVLWQCCEGREESFGNGRFAELCSVSRRCPLLDRMPYVVLKRLQRWGGGGL